MLHLQGQFAPQGTRQYPETCVAVAAGGVLSERRLEMPTILLWARNQPHNKGRPGPNVDSAKVEKC